MAQDLVNNDLHVNGALSCKSFNAPPGSITNDDIEAAAEIDATKVVHQFVIPYAQAGGTAVVAATLPVHVCRTSGEVVAVEAAVLTKATGNDRTVNVDVQKSTSGGAFATILTAALEFDDASTDRVAVAGTVLSPELVDGDLLQIVVTVAGSNLAQAQGLIVSVTLREWPQ